MTSPSADRPRVLVTVGRDLPDRPTALRLPISYVDAVLAAGATPVLLPPGLDRDAVAEVLADIDGLLLPGGIDPHPRHFGEEIHPLTLIDEDLDALEFLVIEQSLALGLPVLGICRGSQILNVCLGGSLVQHLEETSVDHRPDGPLNAPIHEIQIIAGTRLHAIVGDQRLAVNSWHHQAVARTAPGLRVAAVADDGVIEAVESSDPDRWILGVQYHPEELTSVVAHRSVLTAFVAACRTGARVPG